MKLDELKVYQQAMKLGEEIWDCVTEWGYFEKKTIGDQLVRSADSIAANIAEGYGRYYYKENKLFCYYSRGSLLETITWIKKAKSRSLIEDDQADSLIQELEGLHVGLNLYIKSIGSRTT